MTEHPEAAETDPHLRSAAREITIFFPDLGA